MTKCTSRVSPSARSDRWLGLGVVTACTAGVLWAQVGSWDFPHYDGAYYYRWASRWPGAGALPSDWSPLYVAVYGTFLKLVPSGSPWLGYAAHRALLVYLGVVLMWSVARRLFPPATALALAVLLLGNDAYLGAFHGVHAAAVVYVLAVLRVALAGRRWSLVTALLVLAGAGVRPEFLLAAVPVGAATAWAWARGRLPQARGKGLWIAAALLLALGAFWHFGTRPGTSRAFVAFSQQSAWAYHESIGETGVAGHFDHMARTRRLYGKARSIAEAARTNPAEFSRHLVRNLSRLPSVLFWEAAPGRTPGLGLGLLCVAAAVALAGGRRGTPGWPFWGVAASFAGSVVAASLVFQPHVRTQLPASPAILLGGAWIAAGLRRRIPSLEARGAALRRRVGAAGVGLSIAGVAAAQATEPSAGRPVVEIAETLQRDFSTLRPRRIHAFGGITYSIYLDARFGSRWPVVGPDPAWRGPIDAFLASRGVRIVIVSDLLREFYARRPALGKAGLEAELEEAGFRRVRVVHGRIGDEVLYVAEGR